MACLEREIHYFLGATGPLPERQLNMAMLRRQKRDDHEKAPSLETKSYAAKGLVHRLRRYCALGGA
jgi:hypothetical protein